MTSGRLLKYLARYSGVEIPRCFEFHAMQSTLWSQPQKRNPGKEQTSTSRVVRVPSMQIEIDTSPTTGLPKVSIRCYLQRSYIYAHCYVARLDLTPCLKNMGIPIFLA